MIINHGSVFIQLDLDSNHEAILIVTSTAWNMCSSTYSACTRHNKNKWNPRKPVVILQGHFALQISCPRVSASLVDSVTDSAIDVREPKSQACDIINFGLTHWQWSAS
jgi:hypothetical protein